MTHNQIDYLNLKEKSRNNRAIEYETNRTNLVNERLKAEANIINKESLSENVRHNIATETENSRHNQAVELETKRSNQAGEQIKRSEISENQRSHRANESISQSKLREESRHNVAVERETNRSNMYDESIRNYANAIQAKATAEQGRHNLIAESQNKDKLGIERLDAATKSRTADIKMEQLQIEKQKANTDRSRQRVESNRLVFQGILDSLKFGFSVIK